MAFIFSFIVLIIYFATSAGSTPYDYFTRLSDSFLQGKYYLSENPPWLSELIPADNNMFFVPYPSLPAILSMPFRLVFKEKFEQQYLAHILGSGIVFFTMLISWSIKKDKKLACWSGALAGLGTIVWFLSSVGSSWYLGQVSAAFFMTAAIYESLNKKRPFLIGIVLGAMYLSRLHTILSLPFFLYCLGGKNWFKNYFYLGLGFLPFIGFNFYYNFIRFGVIWDKGYYLIPGVLSEPWFQKGIFNFSYIPDNLKILLASFPKFSNVFPYITPSWAGLAIWITTPAFIYSLWANTKQKIVQISWLCVILISVVIFSHGTTGFAQFGYRFAVDFYPLLIFIIINGIAKSNLKWHHWLLLIISIIVNFWGVLWINKFGWVNF